MPVAKWGPYAAADTAIADADLNAFPSGTAATNFRLGAAIDNTLASNQGYIYADFELVLSSAVTTGAGAPFINIFIIPALDGTNYATTNGGTTAGPTAPSYSRGRVHVPPATLVKTISYLGLILPQTLFKIMINNQLGVAMPATNTSTAKLYRYNEQSA